MYSDGAIFVALRLHIVYPTTIIHICFRWSYSSSISRYKCVVWFAMMIAWRCYKLCAELLWRRENYMIARIVCMVSELKCMYKARRVYSNWGGVFSFARADGWTRCCADVACLYEYTDLEEKLIVVDSLNGQLQMFGETLVVTQLLRQLLNCGNKQYLLTICFWNIF